MELVSFSFWRTKIFVLISTSKLLHPASKLCTKRINFFNCNCTLAIFFFIHNKIYIYYHQSLFILCSDMDFACLCHTSDTLHKCKDELGCLFFKYTINCYLVRFISFMEYTKAINLETRYRVHID
jgi:hypothetical protein